MNTDISKYVLPLFRRAGDERSFAGTAFVMDGYLVTASHVLTAGKPCYVRSGPDYYTLQYEQWKPRQVAAVDFYGYDIAAYPLAGMSSPLSLGTDEPGVSDRLSLMCWQWNGTGVQRVATQCVVTAAADDAGYIKIATVDKITHGSSGCPVLRGNEVVGMLTMGRDHVDVTGMSPLTSRMETNTCYMFSAAHIRRFIH